MNGQEVFTVVQDATTTTLRLRVPGDAGALRPGETPERVIRVKGLADRSDDAVRPVGLDPPITLERSLLDLGGSVPGNAINSTQSRPGPNGRRDLDAGVDGVYGTADDVRGDDTNAYWFRNSISDPFSMPEIVDAGTYTRDLAALPVGDLFPANAEREVAVALGLPVTEAAMQHDLTVGEVSRTPSHDDVSALRLAESGFDGVQGTADDHDFNLVWGGQPSLPNDCDITVELVPGHRAFEPEQQPVDMLTRVVHAVAVHDERACQHA